MDLRIRKTTTPEINVSNNNYYCYEAGSFTENDAADVGATTLMMETVSQQQQSEEITATTPTNSRFCCKYCSNNYSALRSLRDHERRAHLEKLGDAQFYCYRCALPFYSKVALSAHFRWSSFCRQVNDERQLVQRQQKQRQQAMNDSISDLNSTGVFQSLSFDGETTTTTIRDDDERSATASGNIITNDDEQELMLDVKEEEEQRPSGQIGFGRFMCYFCDDGSFYDELEHLYQHCQLNHNEQQLSYVKTLYSLASNDNRNLNRHLGISEF